MTSMAVTVTGPNVHGGMLHVHKAGCADLFRGANRQATERNGESWSTTVESVRELVESVYADMMDESGYGWESYIGEFHWAPCVAELPHVTIRPSGQDEEPSFWFAEGFSVTGHGTTPPQLEELSHAELLEYTRGLHAGLAAAEYSEDNDGQVVIYTGIQRTV